MSCPSGFGWSGKTSTTMEQILAKTEQNRLACDYTNVMPGIVLESARDPYRGTFPLGGYCVASPSPQMRGLNQSQVVAGENEMRLYTTFTRCPGEMDMRFEAAQL